MWEKIFCIFFFFFFNPALWEATAAVVVQMVGSEMERVAVSSPSHSVTRSDNILDKNVRNHKFQPNVSSQIWYENDFSIFILVNTPLATI